MNVNLFEIMFGSILICDDDDGEKSKRSTERLMNCGERIKNKGLVKSLQFPRKKVSQPANQQSN